MATHPLQRHAFIDIETTGLDPSVDEVIELGLVLVEHGVFQASHRWRFRHEKPLAPMIQALTGLPESAPEHTPSLAEMWPQIAQLLEGQTVVAHNASFERSFLPALGNTPMLDSCELTHFLAPHLRSHSLDALVRWAKVGDGARHRALDDAEDTFHVVRVAIERGIGSDTSSDVPGPLGEVLSDVGPAPREPVQAPAGRPRAVPTAVSALETEIDDFASMCRDFIATGVDVAVPSSRLSDVPLELPRRLPDTARVCREKLLGLLELPRFSPVARGYVKRWLEQTPHAERATLSGWMSERWPDVRLLGLLSMADARCRCLEPHAGAAIITHETALSLVGKTPLVVLDASRFMPRRGVVEGRRLRELRALYELAEVPFSEEVSPTPEAVRALRGPTSLEPIVAEGLIRAAEYFATLLTPPEPIDLAGALVGSHTLLVHDVVTTDASWLIGLATLTPVRRPAITRSMIERVTTVPESLSGVVLGLGTITPEFVATQIARAPGQVRLGLTNSAPLRLANWWPGQSLAALTVDSVTLLGPVRHDDLRRLQLALPSRVTRITTIEPVRPIVAESDPS